MIKYYKVLVKKDKAQKKILVLTKDNEVSHIYTIDVSGVEVALKKPVHYKEEIERVYSRLNAQNAVNIEEITYLEALDCAFRASRTSVACSILKKMRSYRRQNKIQ